MIALIKREGTPVRTDEGATKNILQRRKASEKRAPQGKAAAVVHLP